MSSKKIRIGVVPIGNVPEITSKAVAANVLGYLNLDTDILPPLEHPAHAYDKKRLQYNAGAIIKSLESEPFPNYTKVIGIIDLDIFAPILTYVFGEAKQGGKYALVSLYRLKKNPDGSLTLYIQKDSPGADKESNWLPAPDGPIYMVMRLYWPKTEPPSILPPGEGTWSPPQLVVAE